MNDRIKNMAPQFWEMTDHGLQFNQMRFAELIVRECAKVARNKTLRSTGVSEEFTGTVYIEDEIRNHFGVK